MLSALAWAGVGEDAAVPAVRLADTGSPRRLSPAFPVGKDGEAQPERISPTNTSVIVDSGFHIVSYAIKPRPAVAPKPMKTAHAMIDEIPRSSGAG